MRRRSSAAATLGSTKWIPGRLQPGVAIGRKAGQERCVRATWKPHGKHGKLTMRSDLPSSVYAFPKQRKEPMTDAKHVRNAVARFDQVTDASDDDRR